MSAHITEQNRKRMISTFVEMVKIDSLGKKEGRMAAHLEKIFKSLGCKVVEDGAGRKIGGETGNLIVTFPGTIKSAPFLLSSHMDTVGPGEGIKPVIEGKIIRSDGTTILGSDCKAGLTAIIEALRIIKEKNLPHPPVQILCTICEETGMLGAKNMDYSKVKGRYGLVLDSESAEEVTIKAPASDKLDITVTGLAAHAGMCPERGISAIKVASAAIAPMKLGRIDFETTSNLGIIQGGSATNIVTQSVNIKGEARSHNLPKLEKQEKHMREMFEKAVKGSAMLLDDKKVSAKVDFKINRNYPNLVIAKANPALKALEIAAKNQGIKLKLVASGGGSDANIFYGHGIQTPNLGCGMQEPHTTREYLSLKDFFNCAGLTLETLLNFQD